MDLTLSTLAGAPARNFLKVKVLLHLNACRELVIKSDLHSLHAWASIPDIARFTDASKASLNVILPRWSKAFWGYTDRHLFSAEVMNDKRPHYFYRINSKGLAYLARLGKWYKYLKEAEIVVGTNAGDETLNDSLWVEPIVWPAYPGSTQDGIQMFWPFASAGDVARCWGTRPLRANDINEALNMARTLFKVEPGGKCIDRAVELQVELAQGAGYKVTVNNKYASRA